MDHGRSFLLVPGAARAWRAMAESARRSHVDLRLASAFRSVARQAEIIAAKRAKGITDKEIFQVNTLAGCSEHHTGRAIDIWTPGFPRLELGFADSAAFAWLQRWAGDFGFSLSYPPGNEAGIAFEPWHWCWTSAGQGKSDELP